MKRKGTLTKKPCKPECPKGGICNAEWYASSEGKLWVEKLFNCKNIRKQIIDIAAKHKSINEYLP